MVSRSGETQGLLAVIPLRGLLSRLSEPNLGLAGVPAAEGVAARKSGSLLGASGIDCSAVPVFVESSCMRTSSSSEEGKSMGGGEDMDAHRLHPICTSTPPTTPYSQTPYPAHDFPQGATLRLEAYRAAWAKCLARIKDIVNALHAPLAASIAHQIHTSYSNILPGLPYPELPVICVTNPSPTSTFLSHQAIYTTHLYPTDCGNIMSTMKALVSGLIDADDGERPKRYGTSLANYDINYLRAWYMTLTRKQKLDPESLPKLLVILHDFEQLDEDVIQDMFHICSAHTPSLPLVFLLSLSSPITPTYLHTAYRFSTLSLLQIHTFSVPTGRKIANDVLQKTFFDPDFTPPLTLGPHSLEFIGDHFTRTSASLEGLITMIQLVYLKHFLSDPLSLLCLATPPETVLSSPESHRFLEGLSARLSIPANDSHSEVQATDWLNASLVIDRINEARTMFKTHARKIRLGFSLVCLLSDTMVDIGYRQIVKGKWGLIDIMSDSLRGELDADVKALGAAVQKLPVDQLRTVLGKLHTYLHERSDEVRTQEEDARTQIVLFRSSLPDAESSRPRDIKDIAVKVSKWVIGYLNSLFYPLEDVPLWDIWYTGESPFPSELLNPSIRASLLAGLLRPYDFSLQPPASNPPIHTLPDTSILFKRYLDGGKMLNLYDWFESFNAVLDKQRDIKPREPVTPKKVRKIASVSPVKTSPTKSDLRSLSLSPRKRGRKRKEEEGEEAQDYRDDDETWKIQVQARFMRALHELDYLGFIKHTNRKADHVLRTVFEVGD
ncbi:origin recognition complex subunit 3 N-terminus-domain-containing protein [Cyathus striatus]|nr:origin recognition complex subunit 3 N-terminus-domain-containing protein [Cyathus striatus]